MTTRTVSVRLVADIGSFVSGMTRAGASATGFGNIAGKALGAAGIAGGFAMAIGKASEFESAMSGVQAATMESASVMGDLREAILKAGADSQYSAKEAADAVTAMAKAGVSAADIMGGGLTGALNLAAAGELAVADAAEIASVAMVQFKLSGEDLPHVADLLAAGAGKAMGSVQDMGMALNQAGLVASATGLSIEETTGALAAFASAGLVGSDAGTSFRSMLQRLQNPSKESAQKMAELGLSMYDASGEFVGLENLAGQLQTSLSGMTQATRDQAMAQIFGSDAVRAANVLYSQGAAGIADWTDKVNDSGYAAKQARILTDNLAGDIERLGGALDKLLIDAGEGAQGPMRELVQMLEGVVDGVTWTVDAFKSVPRPIIDTTVAIGAFVLLRGPVSAMLTALAIRAQIATGSFLAAAFSANTYKKALLGLPLALAAFGITRAVGEVVNFINAGDDAREMVDELKASLDGLSGEEKFEATTAGVKQLRDELAKFQEIADEFDDQNWFDKFIWENPFADRSEIENAKESIGILETALAELEGRGVSSFTAIGNAVQGAGGVIANAIGGIGGAVNSTIGQLEAAQQAQEEWLTSLQGIGTAFVEPLATYKTLLDEKTAAEREAAEATAASTDSATDSWEDYVGDVDVSLDELATRLEEQLLAQTNWQKNIATITQRGGYEVGQILAAMGQEGVELTAKMANGTDAEFDRMAALLIEDARRGGAGAAAALDSEMKVMAALGRAGANATRSAIAKELGIGVAEVQRIADLYGINLATGINPILRSLGKPVINYNQQRGRGYSGVTEYADGGYTGDGGKYEPKGVVHGGEFVVRKEQTARHRPLLEAINGGVAGYATGGFVSPLSVPRPRSTAPYQHPISTAGDAAMDTAYRATTNWLRENGPPAKALAWAQSQVGKPYIWGGVGPAGYDCSGFMSAIANVLLGQAPHSRRGATATFPWPGFRPGYGLFTIGSTPNAGGGIGHMAGTLLGTNVESRGGEGVVVGSRARGASNGLFSTRAHLAMYNGGVIGEPVAGVGAWSGRSYSFGERGPETVTPGVKWSSREFSGGGRGHSSSGPANVTVNARVFVGDREITDIARVEAEGVVVNALSGAADRGRYNG